MTVQIHGQERKLGEMFFRGPDFYAKLIDGDDDFIIVREVDSEVDLLFEWRAKQWVHSEAAEGWTADGRTQGAWVLVAADDDAENGIKRGAA